MNKRLNFWGAVASIIGLVIAVAGYWFTQAYTGISAKDNAKVINSPIIPGNGNTVNIKSDDDSGEPVFPPKLSDAQGRWHGAIQMTNREGKIVQYEAVRLRIDDKGNIVGTAHFNPLNGRTGYKVTITGALSRPDILSGIKNSRPTSQSFVVELQFSDGAYAKQVAAFHGDYLGKFTVAKGDYEDPNVWLGRN